MKKLLCFLMVIMLLAVFPVASAVLDTATLVLKTEVSPVALIKVSGC